MALTNDEGITRPEFYNPNHEASEDENNLRKRSNKILAPHAPWPTTIQYGLHDYTPYDPATIDAVVPFEGRVTSHAKFLNYQIVPEGPFTIERTINILNAVKNKAIKLTDWAAAVTITIYSPEERHEYFRADFDVEGILYAKRYPIGPAPVVFRPTGSTDMAGNVIQADGYFYLIQGGIEPLTGAAGAHLVWTRGSYWPQDDRYRWFSWHRYFRAEIMAAEFSEEEKEASEYFAKFLC